MEHRYGTFAGIITATSLIIFSYITVDGLYRLDAFDYAQIAREIVDGNGFSSKQAIYALHLSFLKDHNLLNDLWPNLHRFPLPSLLIAAGFLLFGVSDTIVINYGIIFQSATSALLFIWTYKAIGFLPGLGVVILYTLNGVMLEIGCSGLPEPAVMFFFTLSLYMIWRVRTESSCAGYFFIGVFLGLPILGRTNVILVTPLLLLFSLGSITAGQRFGRDFFRSIFVRAGLFIAGAVIVLAPWMIRNWSVAGSPFFSIHSYFLVPASMFPNGDRWDLSLPWVTEFISPFQYLWENPSLVFAKWWINIKCLIRDYPMFAGTFLLPIVAMGSLVLSPGKNLRGIAWLLFFSFIINAFFVSFTDVYFDKYYYHFFPMMIMLGLGFVWNLLGKFSNGLLKAGLFLFLVVVMANIPGILSAHKRVKYLSGLVVQEHMDFILKNTSEDAVIFSDQSHAITWKTGRRSIRDHYDRIEDGTSVLGVVRFHKEFLPIDGMYLSQSFMENKAARYILSRTFERVPRIRELFHKVKVFDNGAVFFCR